MGEAGYRRDCKSLFSDCYSVSDNNFTTLSPESSTTSTVTVSSISEVWNLSLIILCSITVSVIILYTVVIIHRSDIVSSHGRI